MGARRREGGSVVNRLITKSESNANSETRRAGREIISTRWVLELALPGNQLEKRADRAARELSDPGFDFAAVS